MTILIYLEKHHLKSCKETCHIEVACIIKYEELKGKCTEPGFKFTRDYDEALKELQVDYDNEILAQFWPEKKTAIFNFKHF